ncbi:MAG: VWA domain-containing protein [Bacteroidia bacterium]
MKRSFIFVLIFAASIVFFYGFTHYPNVNQDKVTEVLDISDEVNGLVKFKNGLNSTSYMVSSEREIAYYLEVQAAHYVPENTKRVPLNLSVVIDRSGSMSGEKLEYVKQAVKFIIDNLGSEDQLSVVIYDDEVSLLIDQQVVANQKQWAKKKINAINSGGSTNLSGGMLKGYDELQSNYKSGYVNRVLLLSDGLANQGITDEDLLANIVGKKNQEQNITLSSFGVGIDFNEDLMLALAERGSGNYYFIENPDQIPEIFENELKGLLNVVAQNAELIIDIPEGLKVKHVYGYEVDLESTNQVHLNLRDLVSEETKSLVIEWERTEDLDEYNFTSRLIYDDVFSGNKLKLVCEAKLHAVATQAELEKGLDSSINAQYVLFKSNYLLEQTMQAMDERNVKRARELTEQNKLLLGADDYYDMPELQVQDSIVMNYETDVVIKIEKDRNALSQSEMKSKQKSSKSFNYQVRKKKYKK